MNLGSEIERPVKAGRLPRDFAVGVAILIFCAAAYWVSLGIAEAPAALAQNVQPATFPQMVLAVVALLTVLMMVTGFQRTEPVRGLPKPVMLKTIAVMVAFVAVFDALGLIATAVLFCVILPMIWGKRMSVKLIGYAVVVALALYLVFDVLLRVHFPPGIIENIL